MVHKIVKAVLAVFIVSLLAFAGYKAMNMPDQRTTGERISDAIDAMGDGVDKAERQLKERTPGKKLGDAVKDVGDNIEEKINP